MLQFNDMHHYSFAACHFSIHLVFMRIDWNTFKSKHFLWMCEFNPNRFICPFYLRWAQWHNLTTEMKLFTLISKKIIYVVLRANRHKWSVLLMEDGNATYHNFKHKFFPNYSTNSSYKGNCPSTTPAAISFTPQ